MVDQTAPRREAGTLQGLALALPVTTAVMGSAVLAPNIPQMIERFSDVPNVGFWVPAMVTVPALCIALFSPPAGAIADAFGRRRSLIAAMVAYSILGLMPLVLQNFWLIFASRIGVGICEAFVMTCSAVLIGDYFKGPKRDHWLAMQTTTASISSTLLFPLGGLVGQYGWQYPFAMYGLVFLLVPLTVLSTWPPERPENPTKRHLNWPLVAGAVIVAGGVGVLSARTLGVNAPLALYLLCIVVMAIIGLVIGARPALRGAATDGGWGSLPWLRLAGISLVSAAASLMFFLLILNMAQILVEAGERSPLRAGFLISFSYRIQNHVSV